MKLSIITINYNNFEGLRKTINSVVSQTWRDFEWIVVDGGSTDGSRELIEEYAAKGCFAWRCSEKDKGIYNAMNKGISHAKGEYLNFMNSGDYFTCDTILEQLFQRKPTSDVLFGNMLYMYDKPQRRMQCKSLGKASLSGWDILYTSLPHQASFFRRHFFDNGLRYDESFRVWADLNMFFEMYYNLSASVTYYNDLDIACFDVNGISQQGSSIVSEERERIRRKFLSVEEYDFYKKTFNLIIHDVRRNIKNLHWLLNAFYLLARTVGYRCKEKVVISESKLPNNISSIDIQYYTKSEAIRKSRLLWHLFNKIQGSLFRYHYKD